MGHTRPLFLYYRVFITDGSKQINVRWAVVVAQLVERSLPIQEVRGSNPVIGKNSVGSNHSTN